MPTRVIVPRLLCLILVSKSMAFCSMYCPLYNICVEIMTILSCTNYHIFTDVVPFQLQFSPVEYCASWSVSIIFFLLKNIYVYSYTLLPELI